MSKKEVEVLDSIVSGVNLSDKGFQGQGWPFLIPIASSIPFCKSCSWNFPEENFRTQRWQILGSLIPRKIENGVIPAYC